MNKKPMISQDTKKTEVQSFHKLTNVVLAIEQLMERGQTKSRAPQFPKHNRRKFKGSGGKTNFK